MLPSAVAPRRGDTACGSAAAPQRRVGGGIRRLRGRLGCVEGAVSRGWGRGEGAGGAGVFPAAPGAGECVSRARPGNPAVSPLPRPSPPPLALPLPPLPFPQPPPLPLPTPAARSPEPGGGVAAQPRSRAAAAGLRAPGRSGRCRNKAPAPVATRRCHPLAGRFRAGRPWCDPPPGRCR